MRHYNMDISEPVREQLWKILKSEGTKWSIEKQDIAEKHLRAWDEWANLTMRGSRWWGLNSVLAFMLFPIWILLVLYWDARCHFAYKRFIKLQPEFDRIMLDRRKEHAQ